MILRLPNLPKNISVFLVAILQHLKTERIACQEGRLEARRPIGFGWLFGVILECAGLYLKTYWSILNGGSVNNSILSITQTADHLNPIFMCFRRKSVNVVLADIQFFRSAEFQTLKKIAIVRFQQIIKSAKLSLLE